MNKLLLATAIMMGVCPAVTMAQKTALPKEVMVKGKVQFDVPAGQPRKVWLSRDNGTGKPELVDSVEMGKDLTYSFRIRQDHPGIYKLNILHWDHIQFWSDADVTVASRGYDTAKMKMKIPHFYFVQGSSDNNFINQMELNSTNGYLRMIEEYNEEYYAKAHKEKNGDRAWIKYLQTRTRYNRSNDDAAMRQDLLLKIYKDRPVLIYALRYSGSPEDTAKYNATLAQLDHLLALYPWLTEAKNLKNTIVSNRQQAMKLMPGQQAPAIAYPDTTGRLQGLDIYKGKYVLIDFWASWCGPCRQAIPKVKELYSQYKEKGLEVLSVSIDTDKKAWAKAMADEKMPWQQLLSPDKDKTMKDFMFSGIPTLYLLDREGKIISKYTGYSPDAEAAIKAVLDKGAAAPSGGQKVMRAMSM